MCLDDLVGTVKPKIQHAVYDIKKSPSKHWTISHCSVFTPYEIIEVMHLARMIPNFRALQQNL